MRNQFNRQTNGYYLGIEQGKEIWMYQMYGHTGYIKQAALMAGLELYGQDGKSNQQAISNPPVCIVFPGGPNEDKMQAFRAAYHTLCQRGADIRAENKGKPTLIKAPTQLRVKKPARTEATWNVSMKIKELQEKYPAHQVSALTRDDAKDAYEAWWESTYHKKLGTACFDLKATKVEA